MFDAVKNALMDNKKEVLISVVTIFVLYIILKALIFKNNFNPNLINYNLTDTQPLSFPPLNKPSTLAPPIRPDVPEEIGLAMAYPQGSGVGMDKSDSNSFEPSNPGPLLTDYSIPEAYGESSLTDPTGKRGASQGARIIKIKNTGNQLNYKPMDETEETTYSAAYTDTEVNTGRFLINGSQDIDYTDNYVPENNLGLEISPGQYGDLTSCEKTYPNVVKYNGACITEGDIPYGQVVNGKVNPRLVSRWESYTGDYSREEALQDVDGLLYPELNIMKM
jgi:hypothetical protein